MSTTAAAAATEIRRAVKTSKTISLSSSTPGHFFYLDRSHEGIFLKINSQRSLRHTILLYQVQANEAQKLLVGISISFHFLLFLYEPPSLADFPLPPFRRCHQEGFLYVQTVVTVGILEHFASIRLLMLLTKSIHKSDCIWHACTHNIF